jgi:hypothetical protein
MTRTPCRICRCEMRPKLQRWGVVCQGRVVDVDDSSVLTCDMCGYQILYAPQLAVLNGKVAKAMNKKGVA